MGKDAAAVSGFQPPDIREETYFTNRQTAHAYDGYIGISIPFYWPALHFAARTLAGMFAGKSALGCAELGAGTGNFLRIVQEYISLKRCLAVDHSEPMLAIASRKLRRPGCRMAVLAVSFLSDAWTELPDFSASDIVLASLALDHIHSDEALLSLFGKVYRFLTPGGCFVLAEKCANGGDRESASFRSFERMVGIRERHMVQQGLKTAEDTRLWKRHILEDDCLRPLGSLWQMACRAGFAIPAAAGVALPEGDDLDDEAYFRMTSVSPLSKADVFARDRAYGLGMLFCLKPDGSGASHP